MPALEKLEGLQRVGKGPSGNQSLKSGNFKGADHDLWPEKRNTRNGCLPIGPHSPICRKSIHPSGRCNDLFACLALLCSD